MFGLVGWTIERFVSAPHAAARAPVPRHPPARASLVWSLLIVTAANVLVFWALASAAASGALTLGEVVVFAQCAVGTSLIAFGGLSWALDGSAAPVAAVLRLEPAMAPAGALPGGTAAGGGAPAREIRFKHVSFAYPGGSPVLDRFDLIIPAGILARHRRAERRRQDDAREAAVPALRPAIGID